MKGRLLINVPTVLEGAVLFNIENRQEEIFLKLLKTAKQNEDMDIYRQVLSFIEDWHKNHKRHPYMFDNGCGCSYCLKTREYANLKLTIHRVRRKLDDCWNIYPSERYKSELLYLSTLENNLIILSEERKTMRIHLGFISRRVLKSF